MHDGVAYVNNLADSWLTAVVRATWQGGLALLLAFLISRFIPGIPAWVKCWIWRLAYLKVSVAFLWTHPVELPLLEAAAETMVVVPGNEPTAREAPVPIDPVPLSPAALAWSSILLMTWLFGLALCVVVVLRAWLTLRHWQSHCVAAENRLSGLERCVAELSHSFHLARPPRLLVCEQACIPFVFSVWRPRIVLPAYLLCRTETPALRLMLAHEVAHVKRRDLWWIWLLSLTEALFFFHPLIWLARRESRLVQEMACDELALQVTSTGAAEYGHMLLDAVTHASVRFRPSSSVSAGILETKESLERRIKHMRTTKSGRKAIIISAFLICAAVALVLPWRLVAQNAAPQAVEPGAEASTPRELELLRKEVELARRHVQSERKQFEVGRTTPQSLLERQRELSILQHELASREGDPAAQEQALREALAQTTTLFREQKRRVELGTLPPQSELGFEREIVRLERELHALNRSLAAQTNALRPVRAPSRPEYLRELQLSSPMAGVITEVLVQPGARVKKGDVLVQFDDREAKVKLEAALSQVAAAEAALKLEEIEVEAAQATYQRQQQLAQDRLAAPPSEAHGPRAAQARIAKSRADLNFAQAQANLAQLTIESLTLRAPRDGTVSEVKTGVGEYVSAGGKPLVVLTIHRQASRPTQGSEPQSPGLE